MMFRSRRRLDREWRSRRREFVYLDEVSVTSLVAARDGSIAETIRDTLTRASESETKLTAGLESKIAKLGSESRVRTTETTAKEVVRRAVIQGTFRDLRTGGSKNIPLTNDRRYGRPPKLPTLRTEEELRNSARKLTKAGALLPVDSIARGDVLELEVKLDADSTYRVVTAISSILEIVNGREALFGIDDASYEQMLPIVEIIDRLMVGLVPIQGISTRFRVVSIDGRDHIIDESILEPGSEIAITAAPLEVVGVTEFKSYWKDLRRVLFTDSMYTAYVRVESPELRDGWNPVKLTDVLRSVHIDIDALIRELPDSFDPGLIAPTAEATVDPKAMLLAFGERLAVEVNSSVAHEQLLEAAAQAGDDFDLAMDIQGRRQAFDIVVNAVDPNADRETVRRIRDEALASLPAAPEPTHQPTTAGNLPTAKDSGRKLEVEFVAIYW